MLMLISITLHVMLISIGARMRGDPANALKLPIEEALLDSNPYKLISESSFTSDNRKGLKLFQFQPHSGTANSTFAI